MIRLKGVTKTFPNGCVAVRDINLTVKTGELLVMLGKSGCGKTTLLKMINRLLEPTQGTIYIQETNTLQIKLTELRRKIGYVIQGIGLFPHMNVYDNVALVPKLLGWDKAKIQETVFHWLGAMRLNPQKFASSFPAELSGGQQQRVGVARALAANQEIILMDEPFGALDPITREELQEELIALENLVHRTVVFVTHDIFEAFYLADRIAIMDQGTIIQHDTPKAILDNPANDFIVKFLGRHRKALAEEIR